MLSMLVLTRKADEAIVIDGGITVTVLSVRGSHVRLGFEAPSHIKIARKELTLNAETGEEIPDVEAGQSAAR
jgi:carbon storage regulator